ncbi:MAG: cytochrome c3 family protein [Desulfovibrio sp.]|nr:cytochrome c3 family protein [Desulfovibrio sp.]
MQKNVLLTCAILLLTASPLVASPAMPDKPLELRGMKKTVMFPHAGHEKIACTDCHHLVNEKENYAKCGSAGCHDDLAEKKGVRSLYRVMHAKKETAHTTCLACHAKAVEEKPERKKELTGCAKSKCHP